MSHPPLDGGFAPARLGCEQPHQHDQWQPPPFFMAQLPMARFFKVLMLTAFKQLPPLSLHSLKQVAGISSAYSLTSLSTVKPPSQT